MLEDQGGVCQICKSTKPSYAHLNVFDVDHDHKTGKVRGLLCNNCNKALGLLQDRVDLCFAAAEYLLKYGYELSAGTRVAYSLSSTSNDQDIPWPFSELTTAIMVE